MRVLVDAKDFPVTAAIRKFVAEQVKKLGKVGKQINAVRVYLESNKKKSNDPQANLVTMAVEVPGTDVVIKKHGVEMYQTISAATGAALRHLRKQFERQRTLRRK